MQTTEDKMKAMEKLNGYELGKVPIAVRDVNVEHQKRAAEAQDQQHSKRAKTMPENVADIVTPLWKCVIVSSPQCCDLAQGSI